MAKQGNRPKESVTGDEDQDVIRSVDAFRRILRELRLHARKAELASGLSASQAFVLAMIAERPGASVNEIADATMTDRSSAAAVLDRLTERGDVVRHQSEHDRRRAVTDAVQVQTMPIHEIRPTSRSSVARGRLRNRLVGTADRDE